MQEDKKVLASMHQNKAFRLFVILACFFITNALIAELVGSKIFSLEKTIGLTPFSFTFFGEENLGFNLTAGVVLWPVVFIMTDVINEYFGMKSVKILSLITVGLIIYAFAMIYFSMGLAPNEYWQYQSGLLDKDPTRHISDMSMAFNKIMGQGLWIILASVIAFLIGQIVDVAVFHRIKKWSGERMVWLRATGSTLVSQFIDSYVVLFIAFYLGFGYSLKWVLAIGTVNMIYKFVVAIVLTPIIYIAHNVIDTYLGKELSDKMKREAAD
ncbi:MAG: queuosine precursor transporter [Saprospiraceae bacterium]|nr:queuosine precursor transporter [Saprospiraceae bacterium]